MSLIDKLLKRQTAEKFISIDVGSSGIKIMSLDTTQQIPKLEGIAQIPTPANALNNNMVSNVEALGSAIKSAIEANDIKAAKVVYCLPGPAVFTKRIKTPKVKPDEFKDNLSFEAANYIPHDSSSVHLDFQILSTGTSDMEVLLVAIKNEILHSFKDAIEAAGLEAAVADVDYFAMSNMHEFNYPENSDKLIALLDIGSRYTGVNLVHNNKPCFTGDIPVGGRLYTDALCESLAITPGQAEQIKSGASVDGVDPALLSDTLDRTTDYVAAEIHRQLGFFWTAAELQSGIEKIYLSGGAARSPGLIEELKSRTGIDCEIINPFRKLAWSENFDPEFLEQISPSVAVSVGLAMRRIGDKVHS